MSNQSPTSSTNEIGKCSVSRSKLHKCFDCHDQFERSYQLKRHRFVSHNHETNDQQQQHHAAEKPNEIVNGKGTVVKQHLQNSSRITLMPSSQPSKCSVSPHSTNINNIFATTTINKVIVKNEVVQTKRYFDSYTGLEWNQIIYDIQSLPRSCNAVIIKCAVCNGNFDNLKNIDQHLVVHNGEPFRHQCQLCDEWMAHRSYLIKHVIGHTKPYRYKCEHCQLSVATAEQLRIHKSMVSNVFGIPKCSVDQITRRLNYQCLVCRQTFVNKHLFDSHRFFKHEGKKLYECEVCRQRFIHLAVLLKHQEYDTNCDYPL